MAIPVDQLKTWTGLGSVQQSSATYQSIKGVLDHPKAPYESRQTDTFLQGSYCNDTNIHGDSDVDIVLRTRSFFHYNIDALSEPQKREFNRVHPNPSAYNLTAFKADVRGWLYDNYAGDLDTSGKKALRLKANGNRRSSDVLLVAPHKRYSRYVSEQDQAFVEGVLFITSGGTEIINYPKQHSENMTAKHRATNNMLKPTVRIFKNIRNRAVKEGLLKEGVAPSYFIEGMLHNVPPQHFAGSYQQIVEGCWGWINTSDHASLMCANGVHPLARDNVSTSWPIQGYIDFRGATRTLWTQW